MIEYQIALFVSFLLIAFGAGSVIERVHLRVLRYREIRTRKVKLFTTRIVHPEWNTQSAHLVTGNVVVSLDYFRSMLAGLRARFGGRIKAHENLISRARREAIIRMKEAALRNGCQAIIHIRIETVHLSRGGPHSGNTTGVEVMAFGTALKFV